MNKRSHIHKKADSSVSNPVRSQLQSRPIAQAKLQSDKPLTQTQTENQEFQQHNSEATKLELQAKYGTITPEGQERLTVLQAKMSGTLQKRLEHASSNGRNFANIPISRPGASSQLAVQTKLTIGEPGDKYEREADRVAAQVVNQIHAPVSQQAGQNLQREEISEEEKDLQMKPMLQLRAAAGGMTATTDLETGIQQARSGGQPLAAKIRQPMEQAFGADFSKVKVHTDTQADKLNQSIQAKAFTTGQNVFFRQGAYEPGSRGGQELLAHELTHVVQQGGGAVQRSYFNSPQQSLALASNGEMGLVQRALQLNVSKQLSWNDKGEEEWTGKESAPSPIAQHISKLIDKGVLNAANVTQFVSGHAIAAAMGGENHENNIVGWDGNTHETKQTEFEWAVLKGQQSTYRNALPPQPAEKGQVTVKAELYGDEKWQVILDEWAMRLTEHVVSNWATLKASSMAEINPKIPKEARDKIDDPDAKTILKGIKNALKAGGHSLERVKRIPNDYRISYTPKSKKLGREFELNQENLPTVEFNKSADINTLFQVAKLPKAKSIAIDKWFLYSLTL
ncbi:MAG: DUF4157 domain-containing protein [Nostoc desertorum CM1-VF14]|jgi:hypothetical protein|nr:DUF4157 domain-containing protein [Nostoc desertorum CM1-VF14]